MKSRVTKDSLYQNLSEASNNLIEMVRKSCWNIISDNCLYILSLEEDSTLSFSTQRRKRKLMNEAKTPVELKDVMPGLLQMFDDIYEIDLFIFKSAKPCTIIEIRYRLKEPLEPDYRRSVIDDPPMLHCKLVIPRYLAGKSKKFDVNWELKPWLCGWKMFWARLRFRLGLTK